MKNQNTSIKKFKAVDFQSQLDEINTAHAYDVNANAFERFWSNGWICYIDLLAFSEICKRSKQSAVNTIVRFHKIIDNAMKKISGDIYQFTDCCFFISDDFSATLNFALCVMNGCCAMNKITFDRKDLVKAHFLLRPRITIAYGEYINASNIKNGYLSSQVNPSSFLAGAGIVYAYEIERHSFSHAISINLSRSPLEFGKQIKVGGNSSLSKSGFKKWIELIQGEKIIHFPWPYVENLYGENGGIHIVPKNNEDFLALEHHLFQTIEKMQREFICDDIDLSAAKHPLALQRFAIELFKNAKNANQVTDGIIEELENLLSLKAVVSVVKN